MPNNSTEPTILVKKPDGSFARVKLSELKKNKKSTPAPAPVVKKEEKIESEVKVEEKVVKEMPKKQEKKVDPDLQRKKVLIEMQKPAGSLGKPVERKEEEPKISNEDFDSLLEEDLKTFGSKAPRTSSHRKNEVEDIIRRLTFKVPEDYSNRLRTAIQLFLKDIRSEEKTREILFAPFEEGGLRLTKSQIDEVLKACAFKNEERQVTQKALVKEEEDLPVIYKEPNVPAKTTPFNAFVHAQKQKEEEVKKEVPKVEEKQEKPVEFVKPAANALDDLIQKDISKNVGLNSPKISSRRPMQDVKQVRKEFGPVEEIRNFNLTDLRRLSDSPKEAVHRLHQKFINLFEESYVLFMRGLDAWKQSPLYLDYISSVAGALSEGYKLKEILGKEGKIKMEELKELTKMEEELSSL